jgi:ketosteroid isomerase-like protein
MTTAEDLVRQLYDAYSRQDRGAARGILSDDLHFTSPQDDHIDLATYLEVCFPTADHFVRQELGEVSEVSPGLVFSRYVYELADGQIFSNVEAHRVLDGRILDIEVYFGGPTTFEG